MPATYADKVAVCSVVFPTLAVIVVMLRFYCRRSLNIKLRLNDWLSLAALIFAIGLCIVFLNASINAGLGEDMTTFTLEMYADFNKHIYAGVLCAYLAFGIVKLAVLEFYKSIFDVQAFRKVANAIFGLVSVWIVVTFFLAIFSAWPISNFWTLGKSYAFNHPQWLFVSTIIDTAFDLLILCLPFPIIWNMIGLTFHKKLQLTFIFLTGFFCVIAAGLRIYYGWRLSGTGQSTAGQVSNEEMPAIVYNNVLWCEMEACFSVIAACLPCIGSFLTKIFNSALQFCESLLVRSRSWTSSFKSSSSPSYPSVSDQASDLERQKPLKTSKSRETLGH